MKAAIKNYIEEKMQEIERKRIAKAEEVLIYLTRVIRGEETEQVVVTENVGDYMSEARVVSKELSAKDKIKAAELLGKRYRLFTYKIETKADSSVVFRGLDDPMSITSITVEIGYLCWAWFEESFQVMNKNDFNKVDMSIRGELPMGYFKQITLSFNPWSEKHWLKKRFFDKKYDNVLAITTTNFK